MTPVLWLLGGAVYGPVVSALQELSPPPLQGTMLGLGILVVGRAGREEAVATMKKRARRARR